MNEVAVLSQAGAVLTQGLQEQWAVQSTRELPVSRFSSQVNQPLALGPCTAFPARATARPVRIYILDLCCGLNDLLLKIIILIM